VTKTRTGLIEGVIRTGKTGDQAISNAAFLLVELVSPR
jgi:hypothetical protein